MIDNWTHARNTNNSSESLPPGENWRKSSFSGSMGDCIEVSTYNQIRVRDSKAPAGPHLRFSSNVWTAFVGNLRESRPPSGK
jgi:hypothetical protein